MEDKSQVLRHGIPREGGEPGVKAGAPCPPDQLNVESSDRQADPPARAIATPPGEALDSSARRVAPTPDSNQCRECLGALAHRLAQPITALRGGMELVLMGKRTQADYRALIEQSLNLADDMAKLIISLRELGESGAPGGAGQTILLEQTVAEVLAEMDAVAQSRDLRLLLNSEGQVKVSANPERLREALQSLLAWVIQNSAGSGVITLDLSAAQGQGCLILSPPRLDSQYLQIKVLEDVTSPGLLFSHASKNGALGWAINQRLLEGLGGKLEILTDHSEAGSVRVRFPLTQGEVGKPS